MEWGKGALRDADFSHIEHDHQAIVRAVGQESVDVYVFLANEFARGSITENLVFQFVYRSFYRLDGIGLTQEFKKEYFELMEAARLQKSVDVRSLAKVLFDLSNAEARKLQFSFATKLAHTVDSTHPLYDIDITKYFRFQSPSKSSPDFDARVQPLMDFYGDLSACYGQVLADGTLTGAVQFFRDTYSACIPDIKILDCIFKSAGSRGLKVTLPTPVGGVEATQ